MTELIKINYESGNPTISARELHEALEVKTEYRHWFPRMCEYGFTENTDFVAIGQKRPTAQGNATTFTNHQLTIPMAKEICMLQRTEKGRQFRQYFIAVEEQWNSPSAIMARALQNKRGKILPYAEKNKGLFEIKETINQKTGWCGTQTLITPKGRETFRLLCK